MLLVMEVVEGREEVYFGGELCGPFRGEGVMESLGRVWGESRGLGVLVKAPSMDDVEMVHLLYSSSSCDTMIEVEDKEEDDFCK